MRPNVFMLLCTTDKETRNIRNKNGNINSNFVWDTAKQVLKETPFEFDPKFNQFQIDYMSAGRFAMFRTFFYDSNGAQTSPAIYVDCLE
jgi:hypothetical protein